MQQLFDTIPRVFCELDKSGKITEAFVLAAWRKVTGAQLAERSRAVKLENKRVYVAVAGDPWKKQLESLSPLLLARLNQMLGDGVVKFIEFQVDSEAFELVSVPAVGHEELSVRSSLAKAAEQIADEDLREQFLVTAATYMARQK